MHKHYIYVYLYLSALLYIYRFPTKDETLIKTLKGVFAKNERGYRRNAKNKRF